MAGTGTKEKNIPFDSVVESGSKKLGENIVNRGLNALVDFAKNKYGETQVLLGTVFERYLDNAWSRYNQVRTLATGLEPRSIIGQNSIYVNIGIDFHGEEITTSTVESMLEISNNLLILGTGGIGKSMLMRYLFLSTIYDGEYVPVLLELRRISNQSPTQLSILELIYACLQDFDVELPKEQFEYSLRLGKYIFLLDGFDEIKESMATETAAAIQAFCAKYPKNPCIVTSRPRQEASPLETFTPVEAKTLNKEQAIQLASRIWTADEKTREFCRQLDETLYDKHKDFAENPLLLSMMFLTFMRNSSIPDHLADFYQKSYDALYSAHDSHNKGYFRRDFQCKTLDENKFKQIFSRFCFQTYFKEQYEFSKPEILAHLQNSIHKLGATDISAKSFLMDLRNGVCLIIKDGDAYRFSHRSFQAYFAAVYTSNSLTDEQQKKLFFSLLSGRETYWEKKDYYTLLSQIEPERFAVNALENGLNIIKKKIDADSQPNICFIKLRYNAIMIRGNFKNGRLVYSVGSIKNKYYYYNIIDLFCECTMRSKFLLSDNLDESALNFIKNYVIKLSQEENLETPNIELEFTEIDHSNLITETERTALYEAIAYRRRTPEICNAINEWLSALKAKRESLKSPNFIDEL